MKVLEQLVNSNVTALKIASESLHYTSLSIAGSVYTSVNLTHLHSALKHLIGISHGKLRTLILESNQWELLELVCSPSSLETCTSVLVGNALCHHHSKSTLS